MPEEKQEREEPGNQREVEEWDGLEAAEGLVRTMFRQADRKLADRLRETGPPYPNKDTGVSS